MRPSRREPRLPSFQSPATKVCGVAARAPASACGSAWTLRTSSNSCGLRSGSRGHPCGGRGDRPGHVVDAQLRSDRRRCEPEEAPGEILQPDRVAPSEEGGVERRQVLDEPIVLLDRQGRVAWRHEVVGAVDHQDGQTGLRSVTFQRHRHHGVVDVRRGPVIEPGLPDPVLPVRRVAGAAHDPVLLGGQDLEEVALAVDHDALERRPRLAVDGTHRRA